ncbi:MAG: hypothetical protein SGBAC_005540 [Bacillariaceae sp.]
MALKRRFKAGGEDDTDDWEQSKEEEEKQIRISQFAMKRVLVYTIVALSMVGVFRFIYPLRSGGIYEVWNVAQLWYLQHYFPMVVVEGNCGWYHHSVYDQPFRTDFFLLGQQYPTLAFAYKDDLEKMIVLYSGARIIRQYDCSGSATNEDSNNPPQVGRARNLTGFELEEIKSNSNENATSVLVLYRTHWDRHSEQIDSHLDSLAGRLRDHNAVVARHYCDEGVEPKEEEEETKGRAKYLQNKHCRDYIFSYPTTLLYVGSQNVYKFTDSIFGHARSEEALFAFWFSNVILKNVIEQELQKEQASLHRHQDP